MALAFIDVRSQIGVSVDEQSASQLNGCPISLAQAARHRRQCLITVNLSLAHVIDWSARSIDMQYLAFPIEQDCASAKRSRPAFFPMPTDLARASSLVAWADVQPPVYVNQ